MSLYAMFIALFTTQDIHLQHVPNVRRMPRIVGMAVLNETLIDTGEEHYDDEERVFNDPHHATP